VAQGFEFTLMVVGESGLGKAGSEIISLILIFLNPTNVGNLKRIGIFVHW
jgi:hypothetical protein